jgi:hypothetical protein
MVLSRIQRIKKELQPLLSARVDAPTRAQHASALIGEYGHIVSWLMAERDRAVIEAVDTGTSGVELSELTGLTRSMISKIYSQKIREQLRGAESPDPLLHEMAQVRSTIGHFTRPIVRRYPT